MIWNGDAYVFYDKMVFLSIVLWWIVSVGVWVSIGYLVLTLVNLLYSVRG